ncbi:hypothetical protein HMPREF9337_01542 [Cutibacterium acnes HL096PA3]|nr:hypothetical protein HMPREF9567_01721 [Cutibacterium acnes HL013PA1]EFS46681.1 hypothetical protein HMPREF9580_00655 [Cutibacterium acnes HL087PA2]EFS50223.1 hypothetical protein HMPREF9587_02149 [Cutibacterium acnes HL025PA1]EFS52507.1 hypothetical protein HMPREF9589_02351 [Cutibacterium acnes HL059PA1]EFS58517.1 hypothetical protein HMPREF9604_01534 [Cutibacterium acnes HL036PA1]EFS65828.1 hypothetical protein HMPREF9612_01796 [Cutibacterium acnes HL063PA2]EFS68634.1 hypothetical protein
MMWWATWYWVAHHITFEPLVPRVLHAILSRGVWHRLFVPQVA